jgi:PAS domain S-box-containing protein
MIAAIDLNYRFLAVNRAYADEFAYNYGVRPKAGDNMLALLETDEQREGSSERWSRALAGEEFTLTRELGLRDHARPYELRYTVLRDRQGQPMGALQFAYDISERVRDQQRLAEAEESLRQSQKMEAVGQLTGGIAHDFNNLLTGIIGSLDMMQRRFAQGRTVDVNAYAMAAMTAANRAASLTHRLLAFSRRQPLDPKARRRQSSDQWYGRVVAPDDRRIHSARDRDCRRSVAHALRPASAGERRAVSRNQCARCDAGRRQAHDRSGELAYRQCLCVEGA